MASQAAAANASHGTSARAEEPEQVTLLELVTAVSEVTCNEDEIVATVLHMLGSGHVKLCGNFRGVPIDRLR